MKKLIKTKLLVIFLLLTISSCGKIEKKEEIIKIGEKQKILALGDSITAGYGLKIEDSYPLQLQFVLEKNGYNYEVVNAGLNGETSSQLLNRIDLYLEKDEKLPQIVILVIGGNDGLRGQNLKKLEENIEKAVSKLKEKNIKIVLGGMKIPPNLGIFYARDFHKLYEKIAKKNKIHLIDFFLEGVAGNRNLNLNDGIHPNKKGYEVIVKNIFEFLEDEKLIRK